MLLALMHVMSNRATIVEQLSENLPTGFTDLLERIAQQRASAVVIDVTETFVFERAGTIVSLSDGAQPALIDSTALWAECVQILRVQFQTASRHIERAGHPAWRKANN